MLIARPDIEAMPDDQMQADPGVGQSVLDCLTALSTVVSSLHEDLRPPVKVVFPFVATALRSRYAIVRQAAARCFAEICNVITVDGMHFLVDSIIPYLGDPSLVANRQGTVELIYRTCLVHHRRRLLSVCAQTLCRNST